MTTNYSIDARPANFSFAPFRVFVRGATPEQALIKFRATHPTATPVTICPEGRPELRKAV